MKTTRALMFAGAHLFLISCGDDADSDTPMTKGEYCDSTGTAFCERVQDCQLETFNACFQAFKGGCCINDGSCNLTAMNESDLRALERNCVAALSSEACAEVEAGVIPAVCLMSP
jgi:hypothetical protein